MVKEEHDMCCVARIQGEHNADSKDDTLGSRNWPYVMKLSKRKSR